MSPLEEDLTIVPKVRRVGQRTLRPSCSQCCSDPPLTAAAARRLAGLAPVLRVVQRRRASMETPPVSCPCRAAAIASRLLAGMDREAFVTIHLDAKRRALSVELIAIGTLSATLVHPREVFKGAILASAAAIVLAHNHPSGDPTPSREDLALTKQLIAAGELLGVTVEDHLIIGATTVSMREATTLWFPAAT